MHGFPEAYQWQLTVPGNSAVHHWTAVHFWFLFLFCNHATLYMVISSSDRMHCLWIGQVSNPHIQLFHLNCTIDLQLLATFHDLGTAHDRHWEQWGYGYLACVPVTYNLANQFFVGQICHHMQCQNHEELQSKPTVVLSFCVEFLAIVVMASRKSSHNSMDSRRCIQCNSMCTPRNDMWTFARQAGMTG